MNLPGETCSKRTTEGKDFMSSVSGWTFCGSKDTTTMSRSPSPSKSPAIATRHRHLRQPVKSEAEISEVFQPLDPMPGGDVVIVEGIAVGIENVGFAVAVQVDPLDAVGAISQIWGPPKRSAVEFPVSLVEERLHALVLVADQGEEIRAAIGIQVADWDVHRARAEIEYFRFEARTLVAGGILEQADLARAVPAELGDDHVGPAGRAGVDRPRVRHTPSPDAKTTSSNFSSLSAPAAARRPGRGRDLPPGHFPSRLPAGPCFRLRRGRKTLCDRDCATAQGGGTAVDRGGPIPWGLSGQHIGGQEDRGSVPAKSCPTEPGDGWRTHGRLVILQLLRSERNAELSGGFRRYGVREPLRRARERKYAAVWPIGGGSRSVRPDIA